MVEGSRHDRALISLRPYTTLVVKDFQNAVGDALPREALTKLPEAVVADLIDRAGVQIAIALADQKGLFILRRQELAARRFEAGGASLKAA